jgi:Uma2 family endonuclease
MVTATAPPETVADLLARLGGIPPERIRMQPPPGMATDADVLAALAGPRKRLCELIDGVLVEKAMGFTEAVLAGAMIDYLREIVHAGNLGIVAGADGLVRLWEGHVRIPDVAFFSWDRLPERHMPTQAIPDISPDLAVEVLSASNTPAEMRLKREDYFGADVKLVWEVDPQTRTVTVYTDVDESIVLHENDTLDGGLVLPGFTLPLGGLFAELDRQG